MNVLIERTAYDKWTRWKKVTVWTLQILVALIFLAAGGAKLAGMERMVTIFDDIGIGQWFRYLTGGLEVIGGIVVLVPRLAVAAALVLACIMVGAVFTHLAVIGGSPLPALVLLVLTVAIVWLHLTPAKGQRAR